MAKIKKEDVIKAYKKIFGGPDGTTVLKDLAYRCGLNQKAGIKTNVQDYAYFEGKRSVFMEIMQMLAVDDEELFKIIIGSYDHGK